MNTEFFIARKMMQQAKKGGSISRPILRITILAISLGLAVMIISVSVLQGFQSEITKKISGFGSHVQITAFDNNNSLEAKPISRNQPFYNKIKNLPQVQNIQAFATKGGIIKTDNDIEGIILKGVGGDYDWSYFKTKLVEGDILSLNDSAKSSGILISEQTAKKLKFKLNDRLYIYFIQQPARMRKFKVTGIYKTGLEEFDNKYAFVDIGHIRKLNDWKPDEIAGFEVLLKDFNQLEKQYEIIAGELDYNFAAFSIKELFPQLFDWLNLQDMNVVVILVIMTVVCIINMITALLIVILERTNMIGILKALGASNWSVRKLFIYNAIYIIGRGMLWGNLAGLGLCFLQYYFKFIKLDEASYYVSEVPILISGGYVLAINIGTLIICSLVLLVPSYIITRISPIKAIRFN